MRPRIGCQTLSSLKESGMLFYPLKPVQFEVSPNTSPIEFDTYVAVVDENQISDKSLKCIKLDNFDSEISRMVGSGDFEGKWLQVAIGFSHVKNARIILLGFGKKTNEIPAKARHIGLKIAEEISKLKTRTLKVVATSPLLQSVDSRAQIAQGFSLGTYKFPKFNLTPQAQAELETPIHFHLGLLDDMVNESDLRAAVARTSILTGAQNFMRLLQDTPPNVCSPTFVAQKGKESLAALGVKSEIFGAHKLKELHFNAMLAVGGGSAQEPQLLVMDYHPEGATQTVALVGKGLTMDTGGYSLKVPSTSQVGMKYDMSGAALVIATMQVVAQLKLPIRVVAAAALCENMVDAHAYRVGDVITGYSGKSIEILNTDAEGRVVLSDALAYMNDIYKPNAIFEFSTLTGAMIISLGHFAAGTFFANTQSLQPLVKEAASQTGERVWELPIFEEMDEEIKSSIADIINISNTPGCAGSIAAAAFLREFVKDTPFCHFDIAGVANGAMATGYPKKHSSGYGIALVVKMLELFKNFVHSR